MDAWLIILYLIELVIIFVFGVVIFLKKENWMSWMKHVNILKQKHYPTHR